MDNLQNTKRDDRREKNIEIGKRERYRERETRTRTKTTGAQ